MIVRIDYGKAHVEGKLTELNNGKGDFFFEMSDGTRLEGRIQGPLAIVICATTMYDDLRPYALNWRYGESWMKRDEYKVGRYTLGNAVGELIIFKSDRGLTKDLPLMVDEYLLNVNAPTPEECLELFRLIKSKAIEPVSEINPTVH